MGSVRHLDFFTAEFALGVFGKFGNSSRDLEIAENWLDRKAQKMHLEYGVLKIHDME